MHDTHTHSPALQDQMPDNHCYGCGPLNGHGLQIKSHYSNGIARCDFQPKPFHCTFTRNFVNGGILASVIDCHSIWAAMAHTYEQEGRPPGSSPDIRYVTANLNIDYLKPVPSGKTLSLTAWITKKENKKSFVECEIRVDTECCVHASVLAIRVNPNWAGSFNKP